MELLHSPYRRQLSCGMQQFLFNVLSPRCSIRAGACKNIFYGDQNLLGPFDLQKSPQEPKKHNFLNGKIILFIMYQPSGLHIEEWSFKRIHQELNKKMQFENLWRRSHVNIFNKVNSINIFISCWLMYKLSSNHLEQNYTRPRIKFLLAHSSIELIFQIRLCLSCWCLRPCEHRADLSRSETNVWQARRIGLWSRLSSAL